MLPPKLAHWVLLDFVVRIFIRQKIRMIGWRSRPERQSFKCLVFSCLLWKNILNPSSLVLKIWSTSSNQIKMEMNSCWMYLGWYRCQGNSWGCSVKCEGGRGKGDGWKREHWGTGKMSSKLQTHYGQGPQNKASREGAGSVGSVYTSPGNPACARIFKLLVVLWWWQMLAFGESKLLCHKGIRQVPIYNIWITLN